MLESTSNQTAALNGPAEPQQCVSPGEYPPLVPAPPIAELVALEEEEPGGTQPKIGTTAERGELIPLGQCPSLVPVEDQPTADAHRVINLFGGASEQVIQAGEVVFHAIASYGDDEQAFERFVDVLVKANILTSHDKKFPKRSPKLKKLKKIGESAQLLRRQEVCARVKGFSCLYQLLVLLDNLPGDEGEQTEELLAILTAGEAKGLLSRGYLEEKTVRRSPNVERQRTIARRKSPISATEPNRRYPVSNWY